MNTGNFEKKMQVPYGLSVHGEEEIEAVVTVLRTGTQMGRNVRVLEEKIAALFAKKHGVMLNSGSSANYLAIELIDLPKASEVITPVLTFSTTVAPLVKNGLIPVFVDVRPDTYNIDADLVESVITKNTKAMMIPNLLGNLPDWKKLRVLADRYGLILVEDSADTLGAQISGKSSGIYSDLSTTSFYGSHVINCAGNGGMLCVNTDKMARQARLLRSWGRSSSLFEESEAIENRFNATIDGIQYDSKFIFEISGYNLEPSEMGAAFGLVQLKKLNDNIEMRENNYQRLYTWFEKFSKWFQLPVQAADTRTGWLAFPLLVRDNAPFSRREMQVYLEKHGIQTRTIFTGNILRQPGFCNIKHVKGAESFPVADGVMRGGLLIGCHHGLTKKMINYIENTVDKFLNQYLRPSQSEREVELYADQSQ